MAHTRFAILILVTLIASPAYARNVKVPAASVEIANPPTDLVDGWRAFLSDCVDVDGLVDYRAARTHDGYARFLQALSIMDPAKLDGSNHRIAFWINAYNGLAIQGVIDTYPWDDPEAAKSYRVIDQPIEGLSPSKGFFQGLRFAVGGRRYTLDEIEKQILLRRWDNLTDKQRVWYEQIAPKTGDPRTHFALVCAARGCPKLQRFVYEGNTLDAQLAEVTRGFLAGGPRSRFDIAQRTWQVSVLLKWYGDDFSNSSYRPSAKNLFHFAADVVSDPRLASSLRNERWQIEYLGYDWTLNSQP